MEKTALEICTCTGCMLCGAGELLKALQMAQELENMLEADKSFRLQTYREHRAAGKPAYPQIFFNGSQLKTHQLDEVFPNFTEGTLLAR